MTPIELFDGFGEFGMGMNSGIAPVELPKDQLAFLANGTVRGDFVHPRPPWFDYQLDFGGDTAIQSVVLQGLFQGGCYAFPDVGPETLVVAISGRLFQFIPDPTTLTAQVFERTGGNSQDPTAPQEWLWQSENFVIWNDGVNLPVFFDLNANTTARSVGNTSTPAGTVTTTTTAPFTVLAAPQQMTISVVTNALVSIANNATIGALGTLFLNGKSGTTQLIVSQETAIPGFVPTGTLVPAGTHVTYPSLPASTAQLPIGKMGAYIQGRNWMALDDNIQFIASDIVGGANGRSAVLFTTENDFLVGGGTFRVPGGAGKITAICETNVLDVALGQGPVQVHTTNRVFTCQAPVDRLTWQSLTNPILPVTVIGTGGKGQNSTIPVNGDVMYRSRFGIASVIYARRDFDTWGNVPISREVARILKGDAQNLLQYGSAINFDNRLIMTVAPQTSPLGVYHKGVVAINFDPLSTMQGKKPSCYDGLWPGLNAFQVLTGDFSQIQRGFAFCQDLSTKSMVLRELLPSDTDEIYDNGNTPIQMTFESPVIFQDRDQSKRQYKQLHNGEIWIDQLQGTVHFDTFWKPDDWPCWIPWFSWDECNDMTPTGAMPGFRPRMGLGQPPSDPCDPTNNRPMRNGYYFQFRCVITGQCEFKGAKFEAITLPSPKFAKQGCAPIC